MTIQNLILQFNKEDIDYIRDDVPGKTFIVFQKAQYIGDCDAPILQFIAIYDKFTKECSSYQNLWYEYT